MRTLIQSAMRTRAPLYGLLAVGVTGIALSETIRLSPGALQPVGPASTILIFAVGVALFGAALAELRGRRRTASVIVAGTAFFVGPAISFTYADPAAGILGPLVGFVLIVPMLRRGWPVATAVTLTIALVVADVVLLRLRQTLWPIGPHELVNGIVSAAAATSVFLYQMIEQRTELATTARRYADLFHRLPIAAYRVTDDGRFVAVNDAMVRLYGMRSQAEMLAVPTASLYANPDDATAIARALASDGRVEGELEVRRPDGTTRWIRYHAQALHDEHDSKRYREGVVQDITAERTIQSWRRQREEIRAGLKRLSPAEPIDTLARAICEQIARSEYFRYALLATVGHTGTLQIEGGSIAGTAISRQTLEGAVLPENFGERLRWGPWVDALPDTPGTNLGRFAAAAGVRDLAYVPLVVDDEPIAVLIAGTGTGERQVLTEHLAALTDYGNVAAALVAPGLIARRTTEASQRRIRAVIEAGAFYPVFQPIVSLQDRRVIGYEALTRFNDGTPPDAMFGLARAAGIELELETATMAASMRAVRRIPSGIFLDLNASPELVYAVEPLRSYVARWGDRVVVELTEHAQVADYGRLRAAIAEVGDHVSLAVDDAGAGFASLRHILELNPQFVKLDRQFVTGVDGDPARQALVAGMAHFAKQANMTLIAEGVETDAEARTLVKLRVPAAQGYLFGAPRRQIARPRSLLPASVSTAA